MKVKTLEEERERSLEEKGDGGDGVDPANGEGEVGTGGGDQDLAVSAAAADDACGRDDEGNGLAGDESDRENRSFNESNSTDLKEENPEVRAAEEQHHLRRPANSLQQSEQADNAPKPGSRSGSSNTVAGESRPASSPAKSPDPVRAAETGESAEVRGSAGGRESSDVQSSASLSRRRRKRDFAGGASSGDEESPADKLACVKSQPLAGFLEIIRSHNFGLLFERRLEIQVISRLPRFSHHIAIILIFSFPIIYYYCLFIYFNPRFLFYVFVTIPFDLGL